jgi:hypothetical protein
MQPIKQDAKYRFRAAIGLFCYNVQDLAVTTFKVYIYICFTLFTGHEGP